MAMTDEETAALLAKQKEWAASIQQGWDWHEHAYASLMNAMLWYQQIKNGEIPHGGIQCPTSASPAPENGETAPSNHKTPSPSVTSTEDQP